MKLSESAVESLLRQGRFQEIVADWIANPASVVKLSSAEHQLAIAEALSRTGRPIAARDIANGLVHRSTPAVIRVRCEMVLGLVARELGFFEEAIQRLNSSARLAKECGHARHSADASLAALRLQVERQPREVASAVLQEG